ncbi:hypothetical protein C8J57DRAFT_1211385 [Mycena rebaudengoi]|nr:hypothetical protein C8J57DRAFT_1211385 [Mycena rebaudengoi]
MGKEKRIRDDTGCNPEAGDRSWSRLMAGVTGACKMSEKHNETSSEMARAGMRQTWTGDQVIAPEGAPGQRDGYGGCGDGCVESEDMVEDGLSRNNAGGCAKARQSTGSSSGECGKARRVIQIRRKARTGQGTGAPEGTGRQSEFLRSSLEAVVIGFDRSGVYGCNNYVILEAEWEDNTYPELETIRPGTSSKEIVTGSPFPWAAHQWVQAIDLLTRYLHDLEEERFHDSESDSQDSQGDLTRSKHNGQVNEVKIKGRLPGSLLESAATATKGGNTAKSEGGDVEGQS